MDVPAPTSSHSASFIRDEARHPLSKACDQCHRCKVACDGGRPTCDRCGKNGSACTYSTGKPIGKPKGSKNRTKLETQRGPTNKVDSVASTQPLVNDGSSKRKSNSRASPTADPMINHKRQRSSVCLPSPTSPNDRVLTFVGEPKFSSGTPISSVHASEQQELQAGTSASAYSVPTPEFFKLQLSPSHPPTNELDASFDHDIDFTHDWMSNVANGGAHRDTTLNEFMPMLEQSSFTPPNFPLASSSHLLTEIGSSKTSTDSSKDENHECTCTTESLAIIPELQQYSTGHMKIPIDGVLRLTRRGFSVISNHIDCPHHARTNSAQTSLLACILILMQVAACYAFLRGSLVDPEYQKHLLVSVGGLTIEEDETRLHVVNAVLDAEIRQAVILSTKLEEWGVQLQSGSTPLPCELLLSSIRQKLDRSLEQPENV